MPAHEGATESVPHDLEPSARAAARALGSVDTARAAPAEVPRPWWYGLMAALSGAAGVVVIGSGVTHADHPALVWAGAVVVWGLSLLLMRTRTLATGVRLPLAARFRRGRGAGVLAQLAAAGAAWAVCLLSGADGGVTTVAVAVVVGLSTWGRCVAHNSRARRGIRGRV
ncbi:MULTISPECIES: hypothetical protein [unclassified Streptomyces]|uniref:hypothetical protein n=1 Tax=unclassified Streptomyces TaxID=2593676 RepID=UPI002250F098|nr:MULTISPECIES: hypothetical protein [unclassified Streptomyces]MCX5138409.1 hypothetical protein [Streptomyces sp. NBC_00338]WRZ63099.1 hypothetical protein OG408_04055 [Streptomyces sp. NBC_01257]